MEDVLRSLTRRRLEDLMVDAIDKDPGLLAQLRRRFKRRKRSGCPPSVQSSRVLLLPDEIIIMVLAYLTMIDRATCTVLVCREWRRLKTVAIFREVDFQGLISPGIVRLHRYISRLFGRLGIQFDCIRKLDLFELQNHVVAMKMVLRRCRNLIELRLSGTNLTDSVLNSVPSAKLEHLVISTSFPGRRRLPYSGSALAAIVGHSARLSSLDLGSATLDASIVAALVNVEACHSIRSIALSCFSSLLAQLVRTFPNLEQLRLEYVFSSSVDRSQLRPLTSRLHTIHIANVMPHYCRAQRHCLFHALTHLIGSCQASLRRLSINWQLGCVRPAYISKLISAMGVLPKLTSLRLDAQISLRTLQSLLTDDAPPFPHLQELALKDAPGTKRYRKAFRYLTATNTETNAN